MANKPSSSSSDVNSMVASAWSQHYHRHNDDALQVFKDIVASHPDHIDANYGYALTLRTAGRKAEATEYFTKTKALVKAAHDERLPVEDVQRYIMLARMIDQQLSYLAK
jgi:hypothetical protein